MVASIRFTNDGNKSGVNCCGVFARDRKAIADRCISRSIYHSRGVDGNWDSRRGKYYVIGAAQAYCYSTIYYIACPRVSTAASRGIERIERSPSSCFCGCDPVVAIADALHSYLGIRRSGIKAENAVARFSSVISSIDCERRAQVH